MPPQLPAGGAAAAAAATASDRLTLPAPFSQIPFYPLRYPHPSPIHPLPHLTSSLNRNKSERNSVSSQDSPRITLWAKREDHSSPLAASGNKYRKLEYIVPDILNSHNTSNNNGNKVTTLVTEGAIQSNHTVQVAAVASSLCLDSLVLLHENTGAGLRTTTDRASFLRTGNVQLCKLLDAEVRIVPPGDDSAVVEDDLVGPVKVLEELRGRGKVPYWIPSGASLHPLGGLGYARCAFEIAAQEKSILSLSVSGGGGGGRFDYIFVACGSGSTLAGLIAGFKLLEKTEAIIQNNGRLLPPRRVIGILTSPTKPRAYHEERILRLARATAGLIGLDPERDITPDDVRLDHRFVGAAYGLFDPQTKAALETLAHVDGVVVDPVYTGKVLRGMMHWVAEGEIVKDWSARVGAQGISGVDEVNVLFMHTGGQSALGAYADI
ncbi:hypothetical protein VTN00DRAFT_6378 [Thermoascus crustaceus]|uniref:uncharacterized protein n=1 Tax=Thermoascus crustaceus TaxID=5088 RepID=UPI00374497B2